MMCGTDPYPKDYKAKKYKLEKHSLRKEDFVHLMKNLPVHVEEEDIEEMFAFADKNQDGHLSYSEFQVMVNPPPPPKVPKPHIADIGLPPQVSDFSRCIISEIIDDVLILIYIINIKSGRNDIQS